MAGDGKILAAGHLDIDALQRADDAVAHAVGLGEIARHDLRGSGGSGRVGHGVTSRVRSTTCAPGSSPPVTSVRFASERPRRS